MHLMVRRAAVIGAISAMVMACLAGAQTGSTRSHDEAGAAPLTVQAAAAQTPAVSVEDALQFCLDGIVKSGIEDLEGFFTPMALQQLFPGVENITSLYRVAKVTSNTLQIGVKLETGDIINAEFEIARLVTKFASMSKNPFIKAWGLIGTPALYCAQAGFVLIGSTGFQVGQNLRSIIFPGPPGATPPPESGTGPPDSGSPPPDGGTTTPPDGKTPPAGGGTARPPDSGVINPPVECPAPASTDCSGTPSPPDGATTPPDSEMITPPVGCPALELTDCGSTTPPDSGTAPPDPATAPPADPGTAPPPDDDETAPPDEDETESPEEDETAPPDDDETAPPDPGTAPPDSGTPPPDPGISPPDPGVTPPDGGTTDPPFVCLGPLPTNCQP